MEVVPGKEHEFIVASHSGCVYTFDKRKTTMHSTVYKAEKAASLSPVLDVAFSSDGHKLVTADKANIIRMYEVGHDEPIACTRNVQLSGIPSVVWTEPSMMDDGDMKVVAAWDKDKDAGAIRFWQAQRQGRSRKDR